jgi:hypothetical protein
MLRVLFLTGLISGGIPLLAESTPEKAPTAGVPVLPLSIPGYELRVLDVRKPVLFEVNGSEVEGSLPVFVYYPAASQAEAVDLLRQASDDLAKLGQKPEWTGEELRQVLSKLDAAAGLLAKKP